MRIRRAFVLVLVLLICNLLLLLGLAFCGKRALQYRGASLASEVAQARALAEAGLEDARVKLEKDMAFPPAGADDQLTYSYSEDVLDPDGRLVGSFTVLLDRTYAKRPYNVLVLRSVGTVGPRTLDPPGPQHRIRAELLLDQASPKYFQFVSYRDEGSL